VLAHREGTLVGNVLFQRYLESNRYVYNASASSDRRRFEALADIFQRYSQDYEFDWLLIAAQAYQESRLIQSRRSPAGAVGVMQLLPSTAMSPAVQIPNIEELEANIHAGHKYLRHLTDHYFSDPAIDDMNRHLFAFAAYNAGPTRINRLRREARERGLDPNQWFANVERIAAEKVGREPVIYVRNIFKYYVTYRLMQDKQAAAAPVVGAG
jgi:membrane-bound lytic murein transglycosylase MltF